MTGPEQPTPVGPDTSGHRPVAGNRETEENPPVKNATGKKQFRSTEGRIKHMQDYRHRVGGKAAAEKATHQQQQSQQDK